MSKTVKAILAFVSVCILTAGCSNDINRPSQAAVDTVTRFVSLDSGMQLTTAEEYDISEFAIDGSSLGLNLSNTYVADVCGSRYVLMSHDGPSEIGIYDADTKKYTSVAVGSGTMKEDAGISDGMQLYRYYELRVSCLDINEDYLIYKYYDPDAAYKGELHCYNLNTGSDILFYNGVLGFGAHSAIIGNKLYFEVDSSLIVSDSHRMIYCYDIEENKVELFLDYAEHPMACGNMLYYLKNGDIYSNDGETERLYFELSKHNIIYDIDSLSIASDALCYGTETYHSVPVLGIMDINSKEQHEISYLVETNSNGWKFTENGYAYINQIYYGNEMSDERYYMFYDKEKNAVAVLPHTSTDSITAVSDKEKIIMYSLNATDNSFTGYIIK